MARGDLCFRVDYFDVDMPSSRQAAHKLESYIMNLEDSPVLKSYQSLPRYIIYEAKPEEGSVIYKTKPKAGLQEFQAAVGLVEADWQLYKTNPIGARCRVAEGFVQQVLERLRAAELAGEEFPWSFSLRVLVTSL